MRLHLPTRLRSLRKKAGISAEHLASVMNTTKQTIYEWENGFREPDMIQRMMLARIFNVSYIGLLERDVVEGVKNDEMTYGRYVRHGFV